MSDPLEPPKKPLGPSTMSVHVHLALNQIGSQVVKTRNVVRSSRLDRDVLAVDVAAPPQCLPKGGNAWIGIDERTGQQHADPRRLHRLLRRSGERRKCEGQSENEPDQPHGTSVEDGWRGV